MLVSDPSDRSYFSVDRKIFTDEGIFKREEELIFESNWIFVGLETQLPDPHSYFTTAIGRQPVIVTRGGDGVIRCLLNSCRHRGAIICPFQRGRQKIHVCRYHGWSYDSSGRNVAITAKSEGQYPAGFDEMDHGLLEVGGFASYRGMLFASLLPAPIALADFLGDARRFLDMVIDQSPSGEIEFVPGEGSYTFQGNWKLQLENGLDNYHFFPTHSSYVEILKRRGQAACEYLDQFELEVDGQGSFGFAHGHAVNWSISNERRYGRPLLSDAGDLRTLEARVGAVTAKWMMRQRNLTIFPNLQVIDIGTVQLRTWRPLGPGRTEMTSHCIGMVDEAPDARTQRIRAYEDFFNPSGLASSDDNVIYEMCQSGYAAAAGDTQGYLRGLGQSSQAAQLAADELGIVPTSAAFGASLTFGDETNFHPPYREWALRMQGGTGI